VSFEMGLMFDRRDSGTLCVDLQSGSQIGRLQFDSVRGSSAGIAYALCCISGDLAVTAVCPDRGKSGLVSDVRHSYAAVEGSSPSLSI
jgi:hypothetical protein